MDRHSKNDEVGSSRADEAVPEMSCIDRFLE